MRTLIFGAALLLLILPACSTRSTPCDSLREGGNAQRQSASNTNADTNFPIAIGDTGASVTASPATQAVEFQINNQAAAPQFDLSRMLGGAEAHSILTTETPREKMLARRLESVERRIEIIDDERMAGLASPDRMTWLETERSKATDERDGLDEQLQAEYRTRVEAAANVPGIDLSSLEQIVLNISTWTRSGSDDNVSDEEAKAMGEAFRSYAKAVETARGGE